jgi:hypothetical protein
VGTLRPSPILPRHRPVQEFSTTAAVAINNFTRRAILDKYKHTRVPPEALAIFLGQPVTMWNNPEKYPIQEQTNKVAPEALAKFSARPVTMWNYYVTCQVQEHPKDISPEAMPNYISIIFHLNLPSSRKEISPRFTSVAADIIK